MVITCLSFFLQIAYQYLCHLEEAKKWMERCLGEELPPTTELEESMRNGVILVNDHLVGPYKLYSCRWQRAIKVSTVVHTMNSLAK